MVTSNAFPSFHIVGEGELLPVLQPDRKTEKLLSPCKRVFAIRRGQRF